jgi:hypothetical protein
MSNFSGHVEPRVELFVLIWAPEVYVDIICGYLDVFVGGCVVGLAIKTEIAL